MTDRKLCKDCVYSGFSGTQVNYWQGCSYLMFTGKKRPHFGDICYGYTPKKRHKRKKANIIVNESATAAYMAAAKPKPKCKHPDPDREIKAAAKRILKAVSR